MLVRTRKRKVIKKIALKQKPPAVVGWREWVSLPLLGIEKIKAKIDTGAKTSALHAYDVHPLKRHGRDFIKFKVHPLQRNTRRIVECEAPLLEWRYITDSGGRRTLRPVVRTVLNVGELAVEVEVTLIARDQMGFRMLIGREALKRRWIVDPSKSFIANASHVAANTRLKPRVPEEE